MAFLIALGGILLRILYFAISKSLWYDEWASVEVAQESLKNVVLLNALDTHPPVYFLLLHAAIRVFGLEEWAFRIPSLLAGIGALFAVYFLAKRIFGPKTALGVLGVIALSPFFIHLSAEIRNHGLAIFFCLWGTLSFLKAADEGRFFWKISYVSAAVLAVYTSHFAWFWIAALFLGARNARRLHVLAGLLGLPALFLLAFNTVRGGEFFVFYAQKPGFTLLSAAKQIGAVYWHFLIGPAFNVYQSKIVLRHLETSGVFWVSMIFFLYSMVLLFSVIARREAPKQSNRKSLCEIATAPSAPRDDGLPSALAMTCFWIAFIPVFVVACVNPARLEARYFGFAAPFFIMLVVQGAFELKNRAAQAAWVLLFALVSLFGNLFMFGLPMDPMHRENYAALTRYVSEHAEPGDAIRDLTIFRYYEKRFGLARRAVLLADEDLTPEKTAAFERIWYLDGLEIAAPDFGGLRDKMKALGFETEGKEIRFGGEADYSIVNVFRKKP